MIINLELDRFIDSTYLRYLYDLLRVSIGVKKVILYNSIQNSELYCIYEHESITTKGASLIN